MRMGKWSVRGAERATGQMRVILIDAADADAAERVGSQMGLLVATVNAAGEVDDAALPPPVVAAVGVPDYAPILAGTQTLVWLAGIVRRVAVLCFVVAIGIAALAAYAWLGANQGAKAVELGLFYALNATVYGFVLLVLSTAIRLAAALSLAVRDLARNSFRNR